MSESPSFHVRAMLRWRARTAGLVATMVVVFAAGLLLPFPAVWVDYGAFVLAFMLPALAVMALVTLYHMFRACDEHGGLAYALEHTALGAGFLLGTFLMPPAFAGVLILPLLVRNDIAQGVAAWRKSQA